MQPQTVKGLVGWMQTYMQMNERDFFQMAYWYVYRKAEPRCEACFELYKTKGVVPLFVRQFIQHNFVHKGDGNAKATEAVTQST